MNKEMSAREFTVITACGLITAFAMATSAQRDTSMRLVAPEISTFEKGLMADQPRRRIDSAVAWPAGD